MSDNAARPAPATGATASDWERHWHHTMAERARERDAWRKQNGALTEAARAELACLWNDLHRARKEAINGHWSIRCDGLVDRIKRLTLLVGPTPWEQIQLPLLEDGVYQRLHAEMGVAAPVDADRVVQARARINAWRKR